MLRCTIIVTVLLCESLVFAIPPNELPFGSYSKRAGVNFGEQLIDWHDSLGFNLFYDTLGFGEMEQMGTAGVTAIYHGRGTDAIHKYTHYNYARIEAEECASPIRMYNCGGTFEDAGSDTFWVAPTSSVSGLYGPNGFSPPCEDWCNYPNKDYLRMERKYVGFADPDDVGHVINYRVDVRIKIDEIGTPEDVVAYLKVICEPWRGTALETTTMRTITAGDFTAPDTWTILQGEFQIPENIEYDSSDTGVPPWEWILDVSAIGVAVLVETSGEGEREVSVDWIRIHDRKGWDLVESEDRDPEIRDYASQFTYLGDILWGWFLRDEPFWINMPVMNSVLDVARRAQQEPNWKAITAINYPMYYKYWFEHVEDTDVITPDIYPFGHKEGADSAKYAGYGSGLKMQNRLNTYADECMQAYDAASSDSGEFWIIPQCFKGGGIAGLKAWRKPTKSELSCQAYMALASGARGIIFWKYGWTYPYPSYISGVYDTSGTRTDLWDAIRYDINPYVKAIDSTFLKLTRDTAYIVNYDYDFDPPSGSWLDSIYAFSNTPDSNPDLGWFHVGEFTEGSDKYIMLVNRACSQGENDPTPAPSITATVKFDPTELGLGPYVYVIDIATGTDSADWVGIPDTTYSATLNGTIPFTTVLGPGEGRLFKIVGTIHQ